MPKSTPNKGKADESTPCTAEAHHYLLETPAGRVSMGRCKYCGLEKAFRNSHEITYWANRGKAKKGAKQ